VRPPYIGVTGFVAEGDVAVAERCVRAMPATHRFMAGVLVSAKTLRGEATASRRYPPFERAEALLRALGEAGAWPVVHYNSRAGAGLLGVELAALRERLPSMRGLQINAADPPPFSVEAFAVQNRDVEVVLQVGRGATPSLASVRVGDTYERHVARCAVADEAAAYVARYPGVSHVLLDASGGEDAPLDADLAGCVVGRNADRWRSLGVRVGVAGGLGPGADEPLACVAAALRVAAANRLLCSGGADVFEATLADLSFDAETGVRSPVADPTPGERHQDELDPGLAFAWALAAAAAVDRARGAAP